MTFNLQPFFPLFVFLLQDEISEELGNMRIKPAKLKGIGEAMALGKNKLLAKRKEKAKAKK